MSPVSLARAGAIATATIERPDRLNALNASVLGELHRIVTELDAAPDDQRVRALIVTGSGERAFAAGADIAEMADLGGAEARRFSELGQRLGRALEEASFPSIAAVNGFALGGGLELALCCDLILGAERARFGQPEVNLGLIPGFGATIRLAERVGVGRARRLIYTAETLDAAQALAIGLVDAVFPNEQLLPESVALAERIAGKAPLAVGAAKRSVLRAARAGADLAFDHETQAFAGLFGSADAKEGIRAFLEKREARFGGR